jgi:hypothetical protein
MKRTFITYLPEGWNKWDLSGTYGVLNTLLSTLYASKEESEQILETPYIKKIKITIEEV